MSSALVLNFFPAFTPASSGGELRLGKLYSAVSSEMKVILLTSTDFGARYEEIVHNNSMIEFRFPKDQLWREAYLTLERSGLRGDLSGLAFALAVSDPTCKLRQQARELAKTVDVVIHEFPFSEPIFSDSCPAMEIYNSHNFEASLLSSIVTGEGFEAGLIKLLHLEGTLVARVERVYATSNEDFEKFRIFYGVQKEKLRLCPNGFDEVELQPVLEARQKSNREPGRRPKLLFTGSGHYPNVEAAKFLLEIANDLPNCDVVLAGGLCAALSQAPLPTNVTLFGSFDQATKLRLLSEADLFLNPISIGSGTSLKALEALGAGLPMVSTVEGVRGLNLSSGVHCEICPRKEFTKGVQRMLSDEPRRRDIALAGMAAARETFSWQTIAREFLTGLFEPQKKLNSSVPLVLALNDYSVMQSGSGGIARIRNLLAEIACDVIVLSFGSTFDVGLISPGVLHATIPKSEAHKAFEHAVNDGQPMSVNDGVASLYASSNRALTMIATATAKRAQSVIFEHPYMAPLIDEILLVNEKLPVIYSSHNVEATHKKVILAKHNIGAILANFIGELENRLVSRADLIVCCTESDFQHFAPAGVPLLIVPNGCSIPDGEQSANERSDSAIRRARIGFLGSAHGPNVEAAEFLVQTLIPAFPNDDFEFIGSICDALPLPLPANLRLLGLVSETAKTEAMFAWDVALNPIEAGGGSSLKLPDYMAHGLSSLSTPTGARGFDVVENDAGCVVERYDFVDRLRAMLVQPDLLNRQRRNARRYATESLSWRAVTRSYRERIREVSLAEPIKLSAPRILVVTYRYTEPPLGGAEEYLIEVLKRIRTRCERLDLAAIDVGHLTNSHHFGCSLSRTSGSSASRLGELFDEAHFFPPEEVAEAETLKRCRNLERAWTAEERNLFAAFASVLAGPKQLRVFGGFFWPENHGGAIRRWTSPEFSFLVPPKSRVFQMSGYASVDKALHFTLLRLRADRSMEVICAMEARIGPYFTTILSLPPSHDLDPVVLVCEVDEHSAPGDHRPFGVLLDSASVQIDIEDSLNRSDGIALMTTSKADLSESIDEELRTDHFADWVAALHRTAQLRDPAMEEEFAAVRGPHSSALQAWLAEHATNYDAVLVQGIPFDIIPSTVETLAALDPAVRPRIVTLPHFHGDDRFYHWRRYAESFEKADTTLLFSSSIAEHLGSQAHFTIVPGGGVRSDEHGDPTAERSFRAVYAGTNPFFLVLGRKTASKGYAQAIRAQQALRAAGHAIDLVLIGPDEDGRPVTGEGVVYLGRQPRDVIRGALRTCLAVVTMSRSESFGIVLCEAWLFGKPVIANRSCYSFRELIRHGETGLLVGSDEELSKAMNQLFNEAHYCIQMGRSGLIQTLDRYTWERVADACFNSLVANCLLGAVHGLGLEEETP